MLSLLSICSIGKFPIVIVQYSRDEVRFSVQTQYISFWHFILGRNLISMVIFKALLSCSGWVRVIMHILSENRTMTLYYFECFSSCLRETQGKIIRRNVKSNHRKKEKKKNVEHTRRTFLHALKQPFFTHFAFHRRNFLPPLHLFFSPFSIIVWILYKAKISPVQ